VGLPPLEPKVLDRSFELPGGLLRPLRGKGGIARESLRVIVDGKGRTPLTAQLFSEPGKTLLALGKSITPKEATAFAQVEVELLELSLTEGLVDLEKLLKSLGRREITSVLVEGGGILLGSLFDCGLVDKVIAFIAPVIIGGEEAKSAVAGRGVDKVVDSAKLERISVEKLGGDLAFSGYITERKEATKV